MIEGRRVDAPAMRAICFWFCFLALLLPRAHARAAADASLPARAEVWPAASASIEARGGLTMRDETVEASAGQTHADGTALSHAALTATAMAAAVPLGITAQAGLDRFWFTGADDQRVAEPVHAVDAWAAPWARWAPRAVPRFAGLAGLGYGYRRLPTLQASDESGGAPIPRAATAHGPTALIAAQLAAARWLAIEAQGRAMPFALGASPGFPRADEADERPTRAFAAGVGLAVGLGQLASTRLAAIARYDWSLLQGHPRGTRVQATQHVVAVGLRAAWLSRVEAPSGPRGGSGAGPRVTVASLRGRVRAEERDQGPLANASVQLDDGRTVITDAAGGFRFDDVRGEVVTVRITAPGFRPAEEIVTMAAGAETTVDVDLAAAAEPMPATLQGLVRTDKGRPLHAKITIVERGQHAFTDRRGSFSLRLPPGRYTLEIGAAGYATQRKPVNVLEGEQSIHNIDMRRGP